MLKIIIEELKTHYQQIANGNYSTQYKQLHLPKLKDIIRKLENGELVLNDSKRSVRKY